LFCFFYFLFLWLRSDTANGIFVPAGILQKPFFSPEYDAARNFGALGTPFYWLYSNV
jgi:hypothetical protein